MASDNIVKLGANAGALLKAVAAELGGKGGGRPTLAQGRRAERGQARQGVRGSSKIFEEPYDKGK